MEIVYISPLNYVADALLQQARELIQRLEAKMIAIDSNTALNLSIAATGRSQELVYALVKTFRVMGVTPVLASETPQLVGATELSARSLNAIDLHAITLLHSRKPTIPFCPWSLYSTKRSF